MAVGDIVSGVGSTSANLSFQPASGVEVMITFTSNYNAWIYFTNGTLNSLSHHSMTTGSAEGAKVKIPINNTNYITLSAGSYPSGYSGIQTK